MAIMVLDSIRFRHISLNSLTIRHNTHSFSCNDYIVFQRHSHIHDLYDDYIDLKYMSLWCLFVFLGLLMPDDMDSINIMDKT